MKKLFLLAMTATMAFGPLSAQNGLTGIWYSTWYVHNGQYTWHNGHGVGSTKQMMGDVNGDGKDDAIVFFSSGDWYVALSNGKTFNGYSQWKSGHGSGSAAQFLADVNGEGKEDAIYYTSNGNWTVAYSDGSKFGSASTWKTGHGSGSKTQFTADVNGDGKADAIAFFDVSGFAGKWYVALSGGSTSCWHEGHGSGSKKQFAADVNGDGKADAIAFFDTSGFEGHWYVALSSGGGFNNYSTWITGHGSGTPLQTVGDVNNDGKADAIVYTSAEGDWYAANSTGSKFNNYSKIQTGHGVGASSIMIADPTGTGKNASIAYKNGVWSVLPCEYNELFYYNLWEAWDIKALPYTLGSYQQYDSGDPDVIQEHLKEISAAKIDYLLMDETNNLYVNNGVIFNRAIAVAKEIKKWNENPNNRPMRYAFAIGGIQFSGDPNTIENEAKEVWNNVINREGTGGLDTYLMQDGKPLLVCYYGQESYRTAWNNIEHPWSDKFTIRWCNGINNSTPDLYGWGIPNGSVNSSFLMEVMPGWNNHRGQYVSRNSGNFYSGSCWNRVLNQMPEQVIINSFNEYAEETSVWITNTSKVSGDSEKWGSTDMYWNSTVDYVAQYKSKKDCKVPTADFSADITQSETPATVSFTNLTTNAINYQWDFGDGTYSIEENPSHYYSENGTYTVKLRATGTGESNEKEYTDYIVIGPKSPTNVTSIDDNVNITLYLNDADGYLYIKCDQKIKNVAIFDMQGRLIGEFIPTNNTVNLSSLNNGIYLAVIDNASNKIVRKIVKN